MTKRSPLQLHCPICNRFLILNVSDVAELLERFCRSCKLYWQFSVKPLGNGFYLIAAKQQREAKTSEWTPVDYGKRNLTQPL